MITAPYPAQHFLVKVQGLAPARCAEFNGSDFSSEFPNREHPNHEPLNYAFFTLFHCSISVIL